MLPVKKLHFLYVRLGFGHESSIGERAFTGKGE